MILAAASLMAWGPLGCDKTTSLSRMVDSGYEITISPTGIVKLGYLEEQKFTLHLVDAAKQPVPGETVEITLLGSAHNALVSSNIVDTNSGGTAAVTVTAPDRQSTFTVRFATPRLGYSDSVEVQVVPELLGLTVKLDNQGVRGVSNYQAILFENLDCDRVDDADFGHAFASQPIDASEVPGRIRFDGLRAQQSYTVLVEGLNNKGQIRISGCLDQLAPNEEDIVISLYDTVLVLAGKYAVSTEIKPEGAWDESVDGISSPLKSSLFFTNTGQAILDKIRALVIEEDQAAQEAFDDIRNKDALDAVISHYLSDNGISVASSFEDLWAKTMEYLGEASLGSELDISDPDGDAYTIAHRLTRLSFTNGVDHVHLEAELFPEIMTGVAGFEGANKDILTLGAHSLNFGLIVAVEHIFNRTLLSEFGTETLAAALVSTVNCEQVAVTLLPMLSTVAKHPVPVIENGCEQAARDVGELLTDTLDTLSFYYNPLTIEGTCTIHDSGDSSHIDGFSGIFSLTWANLTGEPTEGPFVGALIE